MASGSVTTEPLSPSISFSIALWFLLLMLGYPFPILFGGEQHIRVLRNFSYDCWIKSVQELSGQICQICGDEIEITVDGEPFVACNEYAFPVCRPCFWGLSSKEAELVNNGSNAEKSCSCTELSLTATDLGRSMDPSTSETEMPSSSNAPTQFGLESQH
ncbi:cellulose synthase A catalytic subunit 2 [UDP-forming]-like [Senna tora]|uniref:Cellulose synthase A catalytic subunit 2 [UDP-forming]-like n=1 Tax=Senna tora TaxID=362788 RepID=A0A834SH34_9FABA|nr:cellulose synthase A catalytic subunit 2 [UDP-forming]-like [Senna tora]